MQQFEIEENQKVQEKKSYKEEIINQDVMHPASKRFSFEDENSLLSNDPLADILSEYEQVRGPTWNS